jgi:hypothetical protein
MPNKRHCVAVLLAMTLLASHAYGEGPKVVKKDGHVSPLTAKVTFADRTTRTVTVLGIGQPSPDTTAYYTHVFKGTGQGNSAVTLWLDTIRAIREPSETDALFVMKSGDQRRLSWINEYGMGGPTFRLRALVVFNQDGPPEKIDLAALKAVEFIDSQ